MKYTLIKNIIIFIFIFLSHNLAFSDNINYIDSSIIRKAFFLNESNWDKYNKNEVHVFNEDKRIGLLLRIEKENYELRFYSISSDKKIKYSLGRFDYQFNKNKELEKVMFFYQNNDNSFLYFDKNNKQKFDIYMFGKIYRKGLSFYFPFEDLKTISIYKLLDLLDDNNLTKEIFISKNDKAIKDKFINKVILPVSNYKYVQDGGRNEIGKFVFIASGELQKENQLGVNCSGHVKEIADNYIRFLRPDFTYTKIEELKIKRTEERMNELFVYYDLKFDTLFGIDWTKNLIDKINFSADLKYNKAYELNNDEYELFNKSRGYPVSSLKEIIFRDQIKDSSYFYFIVLNRNRKENPTVPEFSHISTVVPYFFNNNFFLRIFESGTETSLKSVYNNYGNGKTRIFKIPLPLSHL